MNRTNGYFKNHGNDLQYVAVSRAHQVANTDASEIADAISAGTLAVHEISGAKAVTLADLLKLKAGGGA